MENKHRNFENNLTVFNNWLKNLSEEGRVDDIDRLVVKGVLESFGANFEISEAEMESLGKYSNKGKRKGLDGVWGKEKVEAFKSWVKDEYIPFVERRAGRELHTLWDNESKTYDTIKYSGMMQFLGELTAFAAGKMTHQKYKELTEDRYRKGKKWEYGDRNEPYKPSPHSSFPVDFPQKAMSRLRASF